MFDTSEIRPDGWPKQPEKNREQQRAANYRKRSRTVGHRRSNYKPKTFREIAPVSGSKLREPDLRLIRHRARDFRRVWDHDAAMRKELEFLEGLERE